MKNKRREYEKMKKIIIGIVLSLSLCLQSEMIYAKNSILPLTKYEQKNGIKKIKMFEYKPGVSFGAKKTPKELSSLDISHREYSRNWARTQDIFYYQDHKKMLHIVYCGNKQVKDMTIDKKENLVNTVVVKTKLPEVAGFHYDSNGAFYVVSGQENEKKNPNKIVIVVEKFDKNWKLKGSTKIKGDYFYHLEGITKPFDAGNCRMELYGKYLIIHTAREMFSGHQSNLNFVIDTETMLIKDVSSPFVSHSFNQFVLADKEEEEGYFYYLDHGDANPRALVIDRYSVHDERNIQFELWWNASSEIFPFIKRKKEHYNYTGCKVTGFEKIGEQLITVGASIPQHRLQAKNGESYTNKNVFVIFTHKDLEQSKKVWFTNFNPTSSSKYSVSEPKLIKVNEERFVVLYSVWTVKDSVLCYRELDVNGNILEAVDYKGVSLEGNSQPFFDGKNIYWLGCWDSEWENRIHSIPYGTDAIKKIEQEQKNMKTKKSK